MKTRFSSLLCLLSLTLLLGCIDEQSAPQQPTEKIPPGRVIYKATVLTNDVEIFITPDGVRCALVDGFESVGIDCDWD